jgi:hypothetical protein
LYDLSTDPHEFTNVANQTKSAALIAGLHSVEW